MRRLIITAAALLIPAAPAQALEAGVGRADLTPPTGFYMMGWVRSDAKVTGQHTRLYARVIVLKQGSQKVALIAGDLNAFPGGVVKQAAELNKDRGFSEQNVLASASHTHAAPTGFYNFGTYNTVFMTTGTPTDFKITDTAADPQLYAFMVKQLAAAIRRADGDLAPAVAGWSSSKLVGITRNRSLEAHLANHGIHKAYGTGSIADDPLGYEETIDPDVEVLRVDKLKGRKRVPVGMWSTFADHGTVNPFEFKYYNADHHGSATRVVESTLRRVGKVPASQDIVNAYGNTDEGDQSAGLDRRGPVAADFVGRTEARAMLSAWREAGRSLSAKLPVELRWTRMCFCGQETEGGASDSHAVVGLPLFTGSEEGRGPLYDETKTPFEGRKSAIDAGPQGHKIQTSDSTGSVPQAVPLTALRVGDRMIVSVPGEMTAGMGARVREAVMAASGGSGITHAVISGIANEYLQYFTTPEEYEEQHYEGGSTLYGKLASNLVKQELAALAGHLVRGETAPTPYEFDPTNGLTSDGAAFDRGPDKASTEREPHGVQRLDQVTFRWRGGQRGFDRPVDAPFVHVQRRQGKRWRDVANDLGLQILWSVDDDGVYTARWEVPREARLGRHRFVITGNRYRLESRPFPVNAARTLTARVVSKRAGRLTVELAYPFDPEGDFTYTPSAASGGRIAFRLPGGRAKIVRRSRGTRFTVKAKPGSRIVIQAGGGKDRYGNKTGDGFSTKL